MLTPCAISSEAWNPCQVSHSRCRARTSAGSAERDILRECPALGTLDRWERGAFSFDLPGSAPSSVRADVKFREIVRLIEDDGWRLVAQRGSHRQYEHPTKPGKVTVAGKPNRDVPAGTAMNILRQAGLRRSSR